MNHAKTQNRASTAINARRSLPIDSSVKAKTVSFSHTARIDEIQKKSYISSAPDDFGTNSPQWTIPSSRKAPPPPPDYPGPGQYTIQSTVRVNKKNFIGQTIGIREERNYATDTSNIIYPDLHVFPESRPRTISSLSGKHFYDIQPTPAPTYDPPKSKIVGISIGSKYKEPRRPKAPSPADYNVKRVDLPSSIRYSLPKKDSRRAVSRSVSYDSCNFGRETDMDTPGPGSYNVVPELRRPQRWTERLRVHPKKYTRIHTEHDRPWAKN